jgi:hypothetical protein
MSEQETEMTTYKALLIDFDPMCDEPFMVLSPDDPTGELVEAYCSSWDEAKAYIDSRDA